MGTEEKTACRKEQMALRDSCRDMERDIFQYISPGIRAVLSSVDKREMETLEEIRLRAGKPLMLHTRGEEWFVGPDSILKRKSGGAFVVSSEEVLKSFELMCENSIYAFQDEIKSGFITLRGGHRVGICGKAVLEGCNLKLIKDISGLNIRMSRQVKGCASEIIKYVISGSRDIFNTLIISPPQCGKTTILRDMARLLGDGINPLGFYGVKVAIIDERCEIASCYKGIPQNDVGCRTDVLDGCPKQIGMAIMLRSMSPQVIITDEIGNEGDYDAVMKVMNSGVKLITSAHGYNISELKSRQEVIKLIEKKVFERLVVLDSSKGPGTVREIVDGRNMEVIYRAAA